MLPVLTTNSKYYNDPFDKKKNLFKLDFIQFIDSGYTVYETGSTPLGWGG